MTPQTVPQQLPELNEIKDLGVIISKDLKTSSQTQNVVAKANKIMYTVKRTMRYLTRSSGPLLFKSLIRPILEYGNSAWTPTTIAEIDQIEAVQRRMTRWICRDNNLSNVQRLEQLKMPTLTHRRRRGDLIEIYRHFKYPEAYNSLSLNVNNNNTRGHNFKLVKQRWTTPVRKNFFHLQAANDWNSLPYNVVNAPNLNIFKSRLDKYLQNQESVLHYRAGTGGTRNF